jgi:hypothetical protein
MSDKSPTTTAPVSAEKNEDARKAIFPTEMHTMCGIEVPVYGVGIRRFARFLAEFPQAAGVMTGKGFKAGLRLFDELAKLFAKRDDEEFMQLLDDADADEFFGFYAKGINLTTKGGGVGPLAMKAMPLVEAIAGTQYSTGIRDYVDSKAHLAVKFAKDFVAQLEKDALEGMADAKPEVFGSSSNPPSANSKTAAGPSATTKT